MTNILLFFRAPSRLLFFYPSYLRRSVPYVGTVVDGILNSGRIKAGDAVMIGPDSNGNFESTIVKSIQRKR